MTLLAPAAAAGAEPTRLPPGVPPVAADRDRDRDAAEQNRTGDNRVWREPGQGTRRVRPGQPQEEGTPEGMAPEARIAPGQPHARIAPPAAGWKLGVYAFNTPAGVRITRVQPGGAAARAGLEVGDVIVTVNGYQIGYVGSRVFSLGDELQRRAGPQGEVLLLVQNVRNRELVNMDVRLQRQF
jgi:hypothetical protein